MRRVGKPENGVLKIQELLDLHAITEIFQRSQDPEWTVFAIHAFDQNIDCPLDTSAFRRSILGFLKVDHGVNRCILSEIFDTLHDLVLVLLADKVHSGAVGDEVDRDLPDPILLFQLFCDGDDACCTCHSADHQRCSPCVLKFSRVNND